MTHKCVQCGTKYHDNAPELLSGCKCGAKVFRLIKKVKEMKSGKESRKEETALKIGIQALASSGSTLPESCIKLVGKGKYDINLEQAFEAPPAVYRIEKGKFVIDVDGEFKQAKNRQAGR